MLNAIAFSILGFAVLIGAASTVLANNVIHAAFWLLECAVASAGLIWFLGAEYIAVMQLLVYAGAVGILVIFTVMVTHRSYEDANRDVKVSWSALILTAALFSLIAYGILATPELASLNEVAKPLDLATFGALLFDPNGQTLAFEIASLILTVALIAAVWWTKDRDETQQKVAETDGGVTARSFAAASHQKATADTTNAARMFEHGTPPSGAADTKGGDN